MAKQHVKARNTGILFELLVRQIASDTLSGNNTKALDYISKYFSKGTELHKELQLYQMLYKDKFTEARKAEKFVELVVESRKKLNSAKLRQEKYSLIKDIKESYNLESFFKTRVNDYKILASIFSLFEYACGRSLMPKEVITAKFALIEHISNQKIPEDKIKDKIMEEYSKLDKDIRLLAYKMLLEKFNKKYSTLDIRQKKLLKEYINNLNNTDSLKAYIEKEIPIIKKKISGHIAKCNDQVVKIKLTEVLSQVDNYLKGKIVSEEQILTLMRFYSLIQDLENAHK